MVPEQIILRVVSDNVDMACTAIERAAMDRAVTVIDETFAASYEHRRRHAEVCGLALLDIFELKVILGTSEPTILGSEYAGYALPAKPA
jgi:predicted short-subunit dehydrogenase-like oxidoreductase (DUF2520 family)